MHSACLTYGFFYLDLSGVGGGGIGDGKGEGEGWGDSDVTEEGEVLSGLAR